MRWLVVAIMAVLALVLLGASQARIDDGADSSYRCLEADLLVKHPAYEGAVLKIGETPICGYGLTIKATYGPSIQAWIDSLEEENARLRDRVRRLEKGIE